MERAAPVRPSWPEQVIRAGLASLVVATALWVMPKDGPDAAIVILAVVVFVVAGAIAGLRIGWLAVPAGFWLMFGVYEATQCAECGGGGEEVTSPALVYLVVSLVVAACGLAGGAGGFLFEARGHRFPLAAGAVVAGALFVAFAALAGSRLSTGASANGPLVSEQHGIRFRTGNPIDDAEREIADGAAARLRGEAPVWLGQLFGPFHLSRVQQGPESVLLVYGSCGPAPCSAPATLMMRWTCGVPPEVTHALSPPVNRDGVVLVEEPVGATEPGGKKVVWTGHLEVTIYAQPVLFEDMPLLDMVSRVDGRPLVSANPDC